MTTTPVLTGRHIGEAENAIRALLDRQLEEASLSFPEWTVLLTLGGADPLPRSELVRRQSDVLRVSEAAARATVDGLRSSGLVDEARVAGEPVGDAQDPRLTLTAAGQARFRPVRQAVFRIADELYGDLPPADLEATRRTLAEVTRRANARLDAAG
jgi:DNA-binding MarR family transcriptional regulator